MERRSLIASVVCSLAFFLTGSASPPTGPDQPTNRLAKESSPYLLQHAHNPVDWFPWGQDAFDKAQKEKKLVFLSIGYSSCHWCHVMERESFVNAEVAKILNASFVSIKVDREERPDVDQIYMASLQAMGQRGGWPLSLFLTAEGKPIIGGTYWPTDDREINGSKVMGFKSILHMMIDVEKDKPQELRDQADQIARATMHALARTGKPAPATELSRTLVDAATAALKAEFDPEHGGFGNPQREFKGTKFPVPPYLDMLLQVGQRQKSDNLLGMVTKTLDQMARGGIYDQIGGGFHRYSTERTWTVPHFEKMLYDNGQLAEVYAAAYRQTANPLYRRVVEETLEFVRRDLTTPGGAFYSALDADSDGEEGRYYVWTTQELQNALPDPADLALAKRAFGVETPNFEGKLLILTRPGQVDNQNDVRVREISEKLFIARSKRARPLLDTKVLTAWNGQMIAGYAVAGQLLKEPRYTEAAAKAADFILRNLAPADDRLLRTYGSAPGESARAKLPAYLDDYAFFTHGLLCLHEAAGDERWLNEAKTLTDVMVRYHGDDNGGFFYTASDHEKLFARAKDQHDGAQPSGNSTAVRNLLRLAAKTGEARYRELAIKSLKSFAPSIEQEPTNLTGMVAALDLSFDNPQPLAAQALRADEQDTAKRSDSVVKATATADKPDAAGKQTLTIKLAIDKEWHLYANPIGNADLESAQTTVALAAQGKPLAAKIDYPKGKLIKDPLIGDYLIYEGEVTFKAVVERAKGDTGPLEVTLKFQSCSNAICLLPATVKLTIP